MQIALPDTFDINVSAGDFSLVEPGQYQAKINDIEYREDSNKPYLLITWQVSDSQTVRSTQSLSDKAMPFLATLLNSLNVIVSKKDRFNPSALRGRWANITVTIEKRADNDRNTVSKIQVPTDLTLNQPQRDASTTVDQGF